MANHVIGTTSKSLRLMVAGLISVPLLGLILVSIREIVAGVIRPLLGFGALTKALWAGALIASLIPFAFLIAHGCIAFVVSGRLLWQRGRGHTRT